MKKLPLAPAPLIYKTLRNKDVKINNARAKGEELLREGDVVCVYFSEERAVSMGCIFPKDHSSGIEADAPADRSTRLSDRKSDQNGLKRPASFPQIPVLYEDDQLAVVNKPAGVLSQKDRPDSYSLSEYAAEQFGNDRAGFRPGIANRLDRNTTGVVLIGKTLRCAQALAEMIRDHQGKKEYLAVLDTALQESQPFWLVHKWEKDSRHNQVRVRLLYKGTERPASFLEAAKGDLAICRVCPKALSKDGTGTLVSLQLYTGKSHQLRAQLAEIGCPIAGEHRYASFHDAKKTVLSHQLLHAWCYHLDGLPLELSYLNGRSFTAAPDALFRKVLRESFPESADQWIQGGL